MGHQEGNEKHSHNTVLHVARHWSALESQLMVVS